MIIFTTISENNSGYFYYLLESIIDYIYVNGISEIELDCLVIPIQLSSVLDSTNDEDYNNRDEPSIQDAKKMAYEYFQIIESLEKT